MTRVLDLPVEQLATTLAPLRGPRTDAASGLAPLPLRVETLAILPMGNSSHGIT